MKLKPEPDPFLKAAELAGVPPAECLVVGDALNDIVAGRKAGCRTARATYGLGSREPIPREFAPHHRIRSVREVLHLV